MPVAPSVTVQPCCSPMPADTQFCGSRSRSVRPRMICASHVASGSATRNVKQRESESSHVGSEWLASVERRPVT